MPSDQMIVNDASGVPRPVRQCGGREVFGLLIGCGRWDDHPRHVVDVPVGEDIAYHLDCHAAAGCASCAQQIEGRPKNATGAKLLEHVSPGATTTNPEEG